MSVNYKRSSDARTEETNQKKKQTKSQTEHKQANRFAISSKMLQRGRTNKYEQN